MTSAEAKRVARSMLGPNAVLVRIGGAHVLKMNGHEYARGTSWKEVMRLAFLKREDATSLEHLVAKNIRRVPWYLKLKLRALVWLRNLLTSRK